MADEPISEGLVQEGVAAVHVDGNGKPEVPPDFSLLDEPEEREQALLRHGSLVAQEGELEWYSPAVPSPMARLAEIDQEIEEIAGVLGEHKGWQRYLRWNYKTRARAASEELEKAEQQAAAEAKAGVSRTFAIRSQLKNRIDVLETSRAGLVEQLEATADDFARSMGAAGLAVDSGEEGITADRVQKALLESAPNAEELAGEHGLVPPSTARDGFTTAVLEYLAPIVAGTILSITIGTLIGLVTLNDIRNMDRPGTLVLALLLGTVIVALIGNVVGLAVGSLAQAREQEVGGLVPRLKSNAVIFTLLVVAVLLVAGEVTAEALGIRDLHLQRLIAANRLGGGEAGAALDAQLLPVWVYFIVGTLISGPYVAYKAAKAWREAEKSQRAAWLAHRRLERVKEMLSGASAQQALAHARRLERLQAELEQVEEQLESLRGREETLEDEVLSERTRKRLSYATAAAVGEAQRLHQLVFGMLNDVDPLPGSEPKDSPKRRG
jgi:hypothetical protein